MLWPWLRGGTHSGLKRSAAPAAHTRYLSSPAAATSHGKTQAFVLLLPPQHKPHATFTQPLQCVSPHHVANLHGSMHMATPDDNNHAAIPLRSATAESRNAKNYTHLEIHTTKICWSFVSVLFCLVGSSKSRRFTKNIYELDEGYRRYAKKIGDASGLPLVLP